MANQKFTMGERVKDVITNFKGVVTGYSTYITGCDCFLVQPPVKDGRHIDGRWIDVDRLVSIGGKPIQLQPKVKTPGGDIPAPTK